MCSDVIMTTSSKQTHTRVWCGGVDVGRSIFLSFIIAYHGEKMLKEELLSRRTESPSGYVRREEEVPHFFLQSNN